MQSLAHQSSQISTSLMANSSRCLCLRSDVQIQLAVATRENQEVWGGCIFGINKAFCFQHVMRTGSGNEWQLHLCRICIAYLLYWNYSLVSIHKGCGHKIFHCLFRSTQFHSMPAQSTSVQHSSKSQPPSIS